MEITVVNQTLVFLSSVLCGGVIAFVFDIFRILRRLVHTGGAAAFIEDILYWLISCFLFFLFALKVNGGEIRLYLFIGVFCGMLIYFSTVSRFVIKISVEVVRFVSKITAVVAKVVSYPILLVFSWLKKPLFLVLNFGKRKGSLLNRKIRISLSNFYKNYRKI